MFLLDSQTPGAPKDLIFSASDLVAASECEYRTLRVLDEKLGRTPKALFPDDEMQKRAGELGDLHEQKVLDHLIEQLGPWDPVRRTGVYQLERGLTNRADLQAKSRETYDALQAGADVVFQATFFDGEFLGYADFLVKVPKGPEAGRYAVWDTKLARHAKVGALLQLAAYGDQLLKLGLEPARQAVLVLGDQTLDDLLSDDRNRSVHSLSDLLPVYRERRDRFRALTAAHRAAESTVGWLQPGVAYCGRCNYCSEQVEMHRDLLMVAGMTMAQRKKLMDKGVTTIDALADLPENQAGGTLRRLRAQARMQTGRGDAAGSRTYDKDGAEHTVSYRVLPENTLAELPKPSPGDIFFDFEGDPLWQDPLTQSWGLEYLFGVIESPDPAGDPAVQPTFRPFWAHSRAEERRAFLDFLDYVEQRRDQYPDMHVYHYAAYEKSALRKLSLIHAAGEDIVDSWLKTGVLVDLYATVRQSLRISENSYSIKKLEPLYMGDNLRAGDVTDAGASVVAYAAYCSARDGGDGEQARTILASISDYNEYDCLSTLRLRDWLLQLRGPAEAEPSPAAPRVTGVVQREEEDDDAGASGFGPTPEELRLGAYLDQLPVDREWTAEEQAVAMVAAAAGYHRREQKKFWWEHYDRLESETDEWSDQRNVFLVHYAVVLQDWEKATPRARVDSRRVQLRGTMVEGSDFRPESSWFRMFRAPVPAGLERLDGNPLPRAGAFGTIVEAVEPDPDDPSLTLLTVTEKCTGKLPPYEQLPFALTPDKPIRTDSIEASLAELARTVGGSIPSLPRHPGVDILRRARPRLAALDALPAVVHDDAGRPDYITAITDAVTDLDTSYLAVQGPPGTGKTHVGSHVIARLIARGWKVGVVAQSHEVVENLLRKAIAAGVDPDVVAKKLAKPHDVPWRHTKDTSVSQLLADDGGCLVGGTAWTMTGRQVPAGSLDLLVIDEAGQFSLADTLAVSQAAGRVLLLGDPQQLPQVTQGSHPEPVDESALGWLSARHATLPAELGYFLADSWRMHPDLCRAVSVLSYEGKLESAPAAGERRLSGVPAGVETVLVDHHGNATRSTEESAEVVRQVQRHLGLMWHPGGNEPERPLGQEDVRVVAAYNAQVRQIQDDLAAAGFSEVKVGTVDKFQGQEAAVVIVSMACSAVSEAPRGMEFLLNRNRINVAVSRGQWRAVVVRSPELTNYMPGRPEQLEELGAFIGLCDGSGLSSNPAA